MKRLVSFLLWLSLGLFAPLSGPAPLQTGTAQITVLDRNGQEVSRLVDGNLIRLQITLDAAAGQLTQVNFELDQPGFVVAGCSVPAGQTSCQSEPLRALGWYWGLPGSAAGIRTVLAAANGAALPAKAALQVAPRPVVMVHGFLSDYKAWSNYLGPQGYLAGIRVPGFAVGDGRVPGALNTGNIADPTGRTNTVAQNAAVLQEYIANVKQETGAEMVDLLGHSMGGMISRYYIDRLMGENAGRDVAQLVMLGTPHLGSDCANLPVALGWYLPAALEIRSSYARQIMNPQIYHRKGVAFFELAGDPILEPVGSPCTGVPSDIVVSLDSASGIPLELSKLSFLHVELNTSADVFDQFVKPLLQKQPGEFGDAPDPQAPVPDLGEILQFSRVYTGRVEAGGSQDLTINIEAGVGVATFALYDASRSLEVTVIGASGNAIELDPVANGVQVIDDPATLVNLGYGFNNPLPGAWHVILNATERTPAAGAEFALTAKFIGGSVLQAGMDKTLPQVGEAVALSARLTLNGAPLAIQSAEALVRAPDGGTETVALAASGDAFTASWAPPAPGLYAIDLHVTATSPDGIPVERTAFLTIEAQPDSSPSSDKPSLWAMGSIALVGILVIVGGLLIGVLMAWFLVRRRK